MSLSDSSSILLADKLIRLDKLKLRFIFYSPKYNLDVLIGCHRGRSLPRGIWYMLCVTCEEVRTRSYHYSRKYRGTFLLLELPLQSWVRTRTYSYWESLGGTIFLSCVIFDMCMLTICYCELLAALYDVFWLFDELLSLFDVPLLTWTDVLCLDWNRTRSSKLL